LPGRKPNAWLSAPSIQVRRRQSKLRCTWKDLAFKIDGTLLDSSVIAGAGSSMFT
jgi:hypothetical protein